MEKEQQAVLEFHRTFDLPINTKPTVISGPEAYLRIELIQEETRELIEAILDKNLVEIADALVDLIYVVKAVGVVYGIDLEPIFNEVHRSNMTKVGGHKSPTGKWIKPDSYEPAQLKPILQAQGME